MRLPGIGTEKSHSFYLIIYQVFNPIFLTQNETLRLFLKILLKSTEQLKMSYL